MPWLIVQPLGCNSSRSALPTARSNKRRIGWSVVSGKVPDMCPASSVGMMVSNTMRARATMKRSALSLRPIWSLASSDQEGRRPITPMREKSPASCRPRCATRSSATQLAKCSRTARTRRFRGGVQSVVFKAAGDLTAIHQLARRRFQHIYAPSRLRQRGAIGQGPARSDIVLKCRAQPFARPVFFNLPGELGPESFPPQKRGPEPFQPGAS